METFKSGHKTQNGYPKFKKVSRTKEMIIAKAISKYGRVCFAVKPTGDAMQPCGRM